MSLSRTVAPIELGARPELVSPCSTEAGDDRKDLVETRLALVLEVEGSFQVSVSSLSSGRVTKRAAKRREASIVFFPFINCSLRMDGWKNQLSTLSSGLNVNVTSLNDARLKLAQQVKSTAKTIASEVRCLLFACLGGPGRASAGASRPGVDRAR